MFKLLLTKFSRGAGLERFSNILAARLRLLGGSVVA